MTAEKTHQWDHRQATSNDLERFVALINAYSQHHYGSNRVGASEMSEGFDKDGRRRRRDMEVWFDLSQQMRAFVGLWRGQWPAHWNVWLDATIHPEAQHPNTLWEQVLAWSEAQAAKLFQPTDPTAGIVCGSRVLVSDATAQSVYVSRGYARGITETLMRADFTCTEPAEPKWPAGIACRALNLETDLEAYACAMDESFREEASYVPLEPEEAVRTRREEFASFGDYYEPALWLVALDSDKIVGSVGSFLNHGGDKERSYLYHVFVLPEWRGRGIATALLRESFQLVHDRGCRFAELHVNSENETGALELYRNVGMEAIWHQDLYEKVLTADG